MKYDIICKRHRAGKNQAVTLETQTLQVSFHTVGRFSTHRRSGKIRPLAQQFFPQKDFLSRICVQCFRVFMIQNTSGRPDTLETEARIPFSKTEHTPGRIPLLGQWLSFSSNTSFYRSRDSQAHMQRKSKIYQFKHFIKCILMYILV